MANGSKTRALFTLLAGKPGVIGYGARVSPHPNRIAHVARALGIPCRLHVAQGAVLPEWQAAMTAGAEVVQHPAGYMNVVAARAREDAEESGWYLVPFGAVCDATAEDSAAQVINIPPEVKRIVIPVGSGITLAGILRGLARAGRDDVSVLGVTVGQDPSETLDQYAPKGWRQVCTLVPAGVPYETPATMTRLNGELDPDGLLLDAHYEAKCLPFLRPGDLLWVVAIRQTARLADLRAQGVPPGAMSAAALPEWVVGDSRHIPTLLPDDVKADLLFTCPPYYDLEVYSDDARDLSTLGTYDEFIRDYRAILAAGVARLHDDRFAVVVVGDVRAPNGHYRNFVSDTIAAMQDAGAMLYNEAILVTATGSLALRAGRQFSTGRKLGKSHQNVLTFIKGDWRKAVAACGDIEIDDLSRFVDADALAEEMAASTPDPIAAHPAMTTGDDDTPDTDDDRDDDEAAEA